MKSRTLIANNRFAQFMDSKFVHTIIAILIVINAGVIAAKTFYSPGDPIFQELSMIDKTLLYIFAVEIGLRMIANGPLFFRSYWNLFDFVIIYGSFIPIAGGQAIMSSLRALRLFYLIEISKKMRHILHGVYLSFPGILNVLVLVVILFFIFSLIATNLFHSPNIETFQTLGASAHSLFQVLTGDDWSGMMRDVSKEFPHSWYFFYTYYIVMTLVLLNLFIGVVVGALQNAESEIESENKEAKKKQVDPVTQELQTIRKELAELKLSFEASANKVSTQSVAKPRTPVSKAKKTPKSAE